MRFWDTSAIVPLLVDEPTSPDVRAMIAVDRAMTVWWATPVECTSAIARRERSDPGAGRQAREAFSALEELVATWSEVPPRPPLRDDAGRLVRVHDLRAADAFQLAAARTASDGRPETLPFVTLDDRLALAARREGFPILPG
jgi:predicted nucleic acid-binding protein